MRTMWRADPTAILAFVAVVEQKTFRGAARALGMPKSTVSERVASLEAHLGVQLLVRTTRSVALTDVGRRYHQEVAPAIAALGSAESLVADAIERPTGRVRMTAPVELGQTTLGKILGRYATEHPDVRVEVDLVDRHVRLVEEGYDLALRVGPLVDSGLVGRKLGPPQRLGLYAHPNYLKRAGVPKIPQDLARHRCLVMTGAQGPSHWNFVVGKKAKLVPIEPFVAINSYGAVGDLIAAGAGIGRMPGPMVAPLLERRVAREVLSDYAPPAKQPFLVYPSVRHLAPAVRILIEFLHEGFDEK